MNARIFKIIMVVLPFFVSSCEQEDADDVRLPEIITHEATLIGMTKATGGGDLLDEGGKPVTTRGICWSYVRQVPTLEDSVNFLGSGPGSFSGEMNFLLPGKRYYVRAFAANANGTAYGNTVFFVSDDGCLTRKSWDVNWFADDPLLKTLSGTWKVISYEDCDKQQVTFKTDENSWGLETIISIHDNNGTILFTGINTTNTLLQSDPFEYYGERMVWTKSGIGTTMSQQPEWGDKFLEAINDQPFFQFTINNTHLRIYYRGILNSVTLEKVN